MKERVLEKLRGPNAKAAREAEAQELAGALPDAGAKPSDPSEVDDRSYKQASSGLGLPHIGGERQAVRDTRSAELNLRKGYQR